MKVELRITVGGNDVDVGFWCGDVSIGNGSVKFNGIDVGNRSLVARPVNGENDVKLDPDDLDRVMHLEDSLGFYELGCPDFVPLKMEATVELKDIASLAIADDGDVETEERDFDGGLLQM